MPLLDPNQSGQPSSASTGAEPKKRAFALMVSAMAHGAILFFLCWRPAVFVKPQLIAHGQGGAATPVSVTLYLPRNLQTAAPDQASLLSVAVPVRKAQKTKLRKRSNALESNKPAELVEAGSREGSAFDGPAEGEEVMPAIPLPGSFADPKVYRWELPAGLQGDVIVEITIDSQGTVVEERLLQGLGHGIDEKVIAALRDWRFRPATRNGIAIPSKHDVHFHFPS